MSERVNVESDDAPAAIGPYSQAIAHGGVLYCSGAIPLDAAGEMVGEDDAPEQARQCLRNLTAIAVAGGAELTEALQVTVYTTRLEEFPAINEAYAEFFVDPPPARVTIGVAALPKGASVEISALLPLG